LTRVTVQRQGTEALPERGLQVQRQAMRVFHRIELDQAGRRLDRIGVHALYVLAKDTAGHVSGTRAHRFNLISAARAWACRPSPYASSAAISPSFCAPASLTSIRLLRFWKS